MDGVLAQNRSHWIQLMEKAVDAPARPRATWRSSLSSLAVTTSAMPSMCPWRRLIGNVIEPAGITYEELKEKKAIDVVGP